MNEKYDNEEDFTYQVNSRLKQYNKEHTNVLKLYNGNVLETLKKMSNECVHCIITSPPYWGLRKYINEYGNEREDEELGYERELDCGFAGLENSCNKCHICNLINVFNECKRVLRKDGSFFLVYANMYYNTIKGNASTGEYQTPNGFREGDLIDVTGAICQGMRRIGWINRQEITWFKPNGKPDSVTDRCTRKTEKILHFVKQQNYYFDTYGATVSYYDKIAKTTKQKRRSDVWVIPHKKDFKTDDGIKHTAIFPERLIEEIIKGTYSPYENNIVNKSGACQRCETPYIRNVIRHNVITCENPNGRDHTRPYNRDGMSGSTLDGEIGNVETVGWEKNCYCSTLKVVPCTILDPFMGSGTVAIVGLKHRLKVWGIELYQRYIDELQIPRIQRCIEGNTDVQIFLHELQTNQQI